VHASGQRAVVAAAEPAGPQKMYDNNQRALPDVANLVVLRGKRAHAVRVLDNDGAERGLLGRPVLRLRGRGVRTQVAGRADVRDQRLLLQRLAAVRVDIRRHQTVAADRAHQHGGAGHNHRRVARGQYNSDTPVCERASVRKTY